VNDDNHRLEPDVLVQAVRALRDAPIPAGPPAELTAATFAAIRERLAGIVPSESARQLQRRRRIMRYLSFGACSTAAVALVGVLILLTGNSSAIAFEKVRERVEKVDSVTYVDTQVDRHGYSSELKYFNRGKQSRMELVKSGNLYVYDFGKLKALSIAPSIRAYELYDIEQESEDTQAMQFVHEVKRLLKGSAVEDGSETIEGIRATVFKIDSGTMYNIRANYKVWVDPKTALPVRISYERKPSDPTDATPVKRTFDHFDWNPTLKDELFSLEVPEGYTEGIPGFVKPVVTPKKK
jgi:outer membrane lipoprotein-sorting protein